VNGDGLADLVTWSRPVSGSDYYTGSLDVRPGDGRGHFACRSEIEASKPCDYTAAHAPFPWITPAYRMRILDTADADWPLQTGQEEVYIHDVTADGLADIIQIAVVGNQLVAKLWVNEDGRNFRCFDPANHC